jgi:CubicO group peptidase (beta-lactamase class C family)
VNVTVDADLTADFAGAVSVSRGDDVEFEQAYGLADRAHGIPATTTTRFAVASASKSFTALAVVALIAEGRLALDTTARSVLGGDLPLIADDVTVGQLLTHRSGIGDYVDEDVEQAPFKVPVQALVTTEDYLPALDGFPTKFVAGTRFSYCNSGYVVLALLAERVSGTPFHDLVAERVFAPAGMSASAFLRSDELPGDAAIGYLDDGRTNVFHLPVRGNGDGGAYSTLADFRAFWAALHGGRLVPREWAVRMTTPQTETRQPFRYGYGFWLYDDGRTAFVEGCDHGVSFRSAHDPERGLTVTVASTTTDGAWPVFRALRAGLHPPRPLYGS